MRAIKLSIDQPATGSRSPIFDFAILALFLFLIFIFIIFPFFSFSYEFLKTLYVKLKRITRHDLFDALYVKLKRITRHDLFDAFPLIIGYFLVFCAIPSCEIYLAVNPQYPKKALQTAIFFFSMGAALIYFWRNKEEFPSVTDKVAYFTGAAIVPITVIEFLF